MYHKVIFCCTYLIDFDYGEATYGGIRKDKNRRGERPLECSISHTLNAIRERRCIYLYTKILAMSFLRCPESELFGDRREMKGSPHTLS